MQRPQPRGHQHHCVNLSNRRRRHLWHRPPKRKEQSPGCPRWLRQTIPLRHQQCSKNHSNRKPRTEYRAKLSSLVPPRLACRRIRSWTNLQYLRAGRCTRKRRLRRKVSSHLDRVFRSKHKNWRRKLPRSNWTTPRLTLRRKEENQRKRVTISWTSY